MSKKKIRAGVCLTYFSVYNQIPNESIEALQLIQYTVIFLKIYNFSQYCYRSALVSRRPLTDSWLAKKRSVRGPPAMAVVIASMRLRPKEGFGY